LRSICSSFASMMLSIFPEAADSTAPGLGNGRKICGLLARRFGLQSLLLAFDLRLPTHRIFQAISSP